MADPKAPTRQELFKIFGRQDLVITFEKLFNKAGEESPLAIEALAILISSAQAMTNSNSAEIEELKKRVQALEVLNVV